MGYPNEKKKGTGSFQSASFKSESESFQSDTFPFAGNGEASTSTSAAPPLPSRFASSIRRKATTGDRSSSSRDITPMQDDYRGVYTDLCRIYKSKIRPLETTYGFERFHSTALTDSDIVAKPMTDRFVAVMNGPERRVIPGNAAAVSAELPFRGLDRFGQGFLSDKQRVDRGYDYTKTIEWFAQRSDLVLLFFDSHKLDISDEFKSSILALKGQEEKVRVILNKSDMVDQQQLMKVYGALMWSLGRVIQTPEVMRVYLGSFWQQKPLNVFEDCRGLLEKEQADLLKDLRELPRNAAVRKVNEIVKRARLARVHAYIIGHLRKEMPAMFKKKTRQRELIANLQGEFLKIQQAHNVPAGDFPNVTTFRQLLEPYRFDDFAKLSTPILAVAEEALSKDLPKIMARFPHHAANPLLELTQKNPFLGPQEPFNPLNTNVTGDVPPTYWDFSSVDRATARHIFQSLGPIEGKVNGPTAKPYFLNTGLSTGVLGKIWTLADWTNDGYLSEEEFAVALHLVRAVENGGEGVLPSTLPASMLP
ncbi:Dynamin [Modicella reniformis]|uniref:Dynamin n=1 Tax=Modicella reniformis TaxID=1440133 RepID=A0A9P6INL3_9FUNG|nr:Dynamin [Modicella reniformis]